MDHRTPFPREFDSTMIADITACGMKGNYSVLQSLRRSATNIHLHFGACFAKGLEAIRNAYWSERSPHHLNPTVSFSIGARAFLKEWGDTDPDGDGTKKTLAAGFDAIASYLEQYPLISDAFIPHMVGGAPATEITFALPLPGLAHPDGGPILYVGRYDQLCRYRDGSSLYIEDDKTCSQLGASWATDFRLRGQLTGYAWAAREHDLRVSGILVRGVCILTKDITHAQVIEQRPDWMIDRWLLQTREKIIKFKSAWRDGMFDQALSEACSRFGGCPYLDLCTAEHPENWMHQYVIKKWDPLAKGEPE